MDWLAGRIRWEHILHALHERATAEPSAGAVDDITAALDELTADAADRNDRAA